MMEKRSQYFKTLKIPTPVAYNCLVRGRAMVSTIIKTQQCTRHTLTVRSHRALVLTLTLEWVQNPFIIHR